MSWGARRGGRGSAQDAAQDAVKDATPDAPPEARGRRRGVLRVAAGPEPLHAPLQNALVEDATPSLAFLRRRRSVPGVEHAVENAPKAAPEAAAGGA